MRAGRWADVLRTLRANRRGNCRGAADQRLIACEEGGLHPWRLSCPCRTGEARNEERQESLARATRTPTGVVLRDAMPRIAPQDEVRRNVWRCFLRHQFWGSGRRQCPSPEKPTKRASRRTALRWGVGVAIILALSFPAHAGPIVDRIKSSGVIRCGGAPRPGLVECVDQRRALRPLSRSLPRNRRRVAWARR